MEIIIGMILIFVVCMGLTPYHQVTNNVEPNVKNIILICSIILLSFIAGMLLK